MIFIIICNSAIIINTFSLYPFMIGISRKIQSIISAHIRKVGADEVSTTLTEIVKTGIPLTKHGKGSKPLNQLC